MTPFYQEALYQQTLDQFTLVESKLSSFILTNQYGEVHHILEKSDFFPFARSKELHDFSLQNYRQYGLFHTCGGVLERKDWGSVCKRNDLLHIEIPLKAGDNTLAHLIVVIQPRLSQWQPFVAFKKTLFFSIGFIFFLTITFIIHFKSKFGKPIHQSLDKMDALEDTNQLRNHLKNIPIEELHKLMLALADKQDALHVAQIKIVDFQSKASLLNLASQVAHDIRSPLSSMEAALGYLGGMRISDPKAPEVLNLLELSAKRLTGIADDLLKRHKGMGAEKENFSIHQVLDELAGEFQGQEKYQRVGFIKEYSSKAIHIQGDAARIQRAFGNMIKNAAEAMRFRGRVTLRTEEKGEKVVVSVADNGPGMPEEKLKRVLLGGFTEGKKEGHGIGMKVVAETIQDHGGRLEGKSIVGEGTVFFAELPRVINEAKAETFSLVINRQEPVLIVDDDPSLREQWRLVLKGERIETVLCDSMEDLLRRKIDSGLTKTAVVDYHYDNSERTGADILLHLKEKGFANLYLCTAEYWKPSVRKLAKDLGVTVCPKPLPKVHVEMLESFSAEVEGEGSAGKEKKNGYNVLVIDDDETIRLSWEILQEKLGIATLHGFENLEALQSSGINLQSLDLAFVDKNIEGSQYDGAQVIEYLKSRGLAKVILASGERVADLEKDPAFAKADFIIGEKIPPNFKEFFS